MIINLLCGAVENETTLGRMHERLREESKSSKSTVNAINKKIVDAENAATT